MKTLTPSLSALTALLLVSSTASAAVLRVSAGAPGPARDGASWATAYTTVGAALSAAASGDEVWTAAGVYTERVTLPSGVALYGGFAGTETARTQRSVKLNETVLDGAGAGTVVTIPANAASATALDGFTVRNGATTTYGGGVFCDTGSAPAIRNNVFIGNTAGAGGGVYAQGASPRLTGNIFSNNWAQAGGGALISGGTPVVEGNTFYANKALVPDYGIADGGGLYLGNANIPVVNNTFVGNSGTEGGGVYVSMCTPRLVNNIFAYNLVGVTGDYDTIFQNNCFYGNIGADTTRVDIAPVGTNGNFRSDPLFANTLAGDLHIQPGSPCRNKGLNTYVTQSTDIDGQARIQGGTVDIGADESDGTTWTVPTRVVFVSPAGSDQNDGSSWASARRTIQSAVDLLGGRGGEVWVANGVYTEAVSANTFVRLYGGFAGTETARSQRQAGAGCTLIDGRAGGRLSTGIGSLQTVIDGFSVLGGPGLRCDISSTSVVSGNMLRGGDYGINAQGASVTIADNTIRDNHYAGILCGGAATIVRNVLLGNGVSQYVQGGAINVSMAGSVIVADNLVAGNDAGIGVDMADSGSITLTNNTVVSNAGNGLYIFGNGPFTATVVNNIVAFNGTGVVESSVTTSVPVYRNNDLYGNRDTDFRSSTPSGARPNPVGTTGNIAADPLFSGSLSGDFRLQPASPCRDKGDNTVVASGDKDVDGQARIQGTRVDIGASESNGLVVTPPPAIRLFVSPRGDDAASGLSWAAAKRTVGGGMMGIGRGAAAVWVAAGTYVERPDIGAFTSLYGGFAGTETALEQRQPASSVSVLDGSAAGPVVTMRGGSLPSLLDGFTIRNGQFPNDGYVAKPGGVLCRYATPTISGNVITANAGSSGGAIGCESSAPTITGNAMVGNTGFQGGGVYLTSCTSTVGNNLIDSNTGGGVYSEHGPVVITGNNIGGNTGSPVSCPDGHAVVSRNYVHDNTGGGIGMTGPAVTVTDNLLVANSGQIIYGQAPVAIGCALADAATLIANNTVVNAPGVSMGGISVSGPGSPRILNNLLVGLTYGVNNSQTSPATPIVTNNSIWGGWLTYQGLPDQTGTNGNISADPAFAAPGARNYRLTAGSPCRDAGANAAVAAGDTDRDGKPRIVGAAVDIGAYEFDPTSVVFSLDDVRTVLAVAAGLRAYDPAQMQRLDIGPASSAGRLDLSDAVALARRATGLDPAP